MDFDQDSDSRGMGKGPFYGAAAFIFVILSLFASVVVKEDGILGHWQIATCILGTGLIAILLFLPHFLESIFDKMEDLLSNQDKDSSSKAFFELKEIRSELDALALKIDKVPTLVEKIVSESILNNSQESPESIFERLKDLESNLHAKLERIEESTISSPLPSEAESMQAGIEKSINKLVEQVSLLQENFPPPNDQSQDLPTAEINKDDDSSIPENDDRDGSTSTHDQEKEEILAPSNDDLENLSALAIAPDSDSSEIPPKIQSVEEETMDMSAELEDEDNFGMENSPPIDSSPEEINEEAKDLTVDKEEEEEEEEKEEEKTLSAEDDSGSPETQSSESDVSSSENLPESESFVTGNQAVAEELDLGLPSPEETLRKVDALLSGGQNIQKVGKDEDEQKLADKNGTTTVVANVMIGIGNKPFLRGEGPGLSWDEGVSMNFVEIGKWAWSPPRKNASLIVQVYRNDQDPDKGGKIEVKPGQKLEITPDFS